MCIYTYMSDNQTTVLSTIDLDPTLCTCASLRKTSRVVTQFFDSALKPAGLTPGQFTVLAALSNRGPSRQADLADILAMDRTTLIRNLRPLESRGLVSTDTASKRGVKTLTLTAAGDRVLGLALPLWQQAQSQIIEALGQDRWGGLITDLASTVEAVQAR